MLHSVVLAGAFALLFTCECAAQNQNPITNLTGDSFTTPSEMATPPLGKLVQAAQALAAFAAFPVDITQTPPSFIFGPLVSYGPLVPSGSGPADKGQMGIAIFTGISGNGYINLSNGTVEGGTGSAPHAILSSRAATQANANPNSAYGSEAVTAFTLANGALAIPQISGDLLIISVLSANSSPFQTTGQYSVGPNAQNVIAADFNGDGNLDLAVSDFGNLSDDTGGNVQIFLGNGDGTFTPGPTVNAGTTPVSMAAADFNDDGNLDLVVANLTVGAVSVLLGDGHGAFGMPITLPLVDQTPNCQARNICVPSSIIATDLNGDGLLDIAVLNSGTGSVSVFLGNGKGAFNSGVAYRAGYGSPTYVASLDLNGDDKTDLIVANPGANAISLLFGNGDGSFQAPVQYVTGASPFNFAVAPGVNGAQVEIVTLDSVAADLVFMPVQANGIAGGPPLYELPHSASGVAAADLNGDRYPDMVVADGVLSVLLRNPNAEFDAAVNYTLQSGAQAVAIAVGNLRGNGVNDVVAASQFSDPNGNFSGTVDVALGNGDGTLGKQNSYALGGYPGGFGDAAPSGIVIGDFNDDRKPDVAAGFQTAPNGLGSGGVSVLLGNGDGTLQSAVTYLAGNNVLGLVTGDFNGDGRLDIAAGVAGANGNYSSPGSLQILLGNGNGTFQTATPIQVGSPAGTPITLAAGDLNADGNLDLVASVESTSFNDSIIVLLGNGNGTFRQLAPITTTAAGNALALVDLNGDGIPDLVVGDSEEAVYLLGNGDGTFQAPHYFSSGALISGFAVTDWNGDGIAGLAIAQRGGTVMALESGINPKRSATNTTASRTFVSTTGNDANNCSAGAPCRTFAAALSATGPGGEVVVVDSGGFGPATIAQPIVITANDAVASISTTTAGAKALTINTSGNVTLNGLELHGEAIGNDGILVDQVGILRLYNTLIENFTNDGIEFVTSGDLSVYGSKINDNAHDGLLVANPSADAYVHDSAFDDNQHAGVEVTAGQAAIADSSAHYNLNAFVADGGTLTLYNDRAIFNGTALASSSGGMLYFAGCLISHNTTAYNAGSGSTMSGSSPGSSVIASGQAKIGTLTIPTPSH